jgi:hypothetical protein
VTPLWKGEILDGGGATSDPVGAFGGATGALRCKSGLHSLVGMFSALGMRHSIVEALAHFGVRSLARDITNRIQ